jgi:hypothetical protein
MILSTLTNYVVLEQIINANTNTELNWVKHLYGMMAIMKRSIENNQLSASGIPMLVLGTSTSSDIANKSISGDLSITALKAPKSQFNDLCLILSKTQSLFKEATIMFEPQSTRYEYVLTQLRGKTIALKSELLAWSSTQPEKTQPKTIERFTQPYVLKFPETEDLLCPTTYADVYHDCKHANEKADIFR